MSGTFRRPPRLAAATGLALTLASCSPDRPGPLPSTPSPSTPGPSAPTIVRLELVAPPEIEPGESVQLFLNAVKSDGSIENLSSDAAWSSSSSSVLELSPTGMATGRVRGEAHVIARRQDKQAHLRIFVVPKGTFALTGQIEEKGVRIPNVTVLVLSGTGQGLGTQSDSYGSYRLYGVAGPVQLELKADGYLTASPQITVVEHMIRNISVVSERPRNDYAGLYTLTISASSDCLGYYVLPDEAKRREYLATISQEGARLSVTLSGADFIVANGRGSGFVGHLLTTDRVSFTISDAWWDYFYGHFHPGAFDIAERVSGSTVVFTGGASMERTASRLSGLLAGTIAVSRSAVPAFEPFDMHCSSAHQFEMVRR